MDEQIINIFKDDKNLKTTVNEIMKILNKNVKSEILKSIKNLEYKGLLFSDKNGKITLAKGFDIYQGILESNSNGFGFIIVKDEEHDVFIPARHLNGAMHKDLVVCKVTKKRKNGKKQEGEILRILEKGKKTLVGTFEKSKSFGFVVPDETKFSKDIFVSKKNCKGAIDGHKVVVEIFKKPGKKEKPEGAIIEILGHISDPGVDILSIVHDLEIPIEFPKEVLSEVENIKDIVDENDYKDRDDFRNIQMVTIDGDDAKDLDDAIHIKKLQNENFELGVHIADVTEYVVDGSILDKEAQKRGTSVYLVDRVIPMLPRKLSNGVCSLNAGVNRLALSCIMEIDENGKVVNHRICKSIIKIDKRMSYTVVNDLLENEKSNHKKDNVDLLDMFEQMKHLRNILKEKRDLRGAIDFDFPEAKIILDNLGKPIEIKVYERNLATSIIEEFMLLCNETVAEEYYWLGLPFVFRSHNKPDSENIERLKEFIQGLGYYLKGKSQHAKSIQTLLKEVSGKKEESVISRLTLRSMKQARYTQKNEGHFGLASKYYTHFTSPIRRYPDLQIHRIIKYNLDKNMVGKVKDKLENNISEISLNCSTKERRAEQAERSVNKLKKVEFMKDKIGKNFAGTINSITSWGIYVELENTVEGMVSISGMLDDNYIYDSEKMKYLGETTGKEYSLGEKVEIKVVRANIKERKLDFEFLYE